MNENLIEILQKTLDVFDVNPRFYALEFVRDESTCLVKDGNVWSVFFSEKRRRTSEKRTEDLQKACRFLLADVADSDEDAEKMVKKFDELAADLTKS